MSLLEAKKLSAFYNGSIALSEVNFLVNEGSVIALMGRNGMGKTTLIHCVCGIISEKSGLIKRFDKAEWGSCTGYGHLSV